MALFYDKPLTPFSGNDIEDSAAEAFYEMLTVRHHFEQTVWHASLQSCSYIIYLLWLRDMRQKDAYLPQFLIFPMEFRNRDRDLHWHIRSILYHSKTIIIIILLWRSIRIFIDIFLYTIGKFTLYFFLCNRELPQ